MITNQPFMLLLGLGATGIAVLLTAFKFMRNIKVLLALVVAGVGMSVVQIILSVHEQTSKQTTLSDSLHSLLVYVIVYNGFRYAYIKAYGFEPTYNRMSWYDHQEGRRQNGFDVLVFVAPLFLSLAFPILLGILKK